MTYSTLRKIIKIKLIGAKLLITAGIVHPAKHQPHIELEEYRNRKSNSYISLFLK